MQAGFQLAAPQKLAPNNLNPGVALQQLLPGNQRFAANQLTSVEHDLTILSQRTVNSPKKGRTVLYLPR